MKKTELNIGMIIGEGVGLFLSFFVDVNVFLLILLGGVWGGFIDQKEKGKD